MNSELLRKSLKLAVAAFLTAAIAVFFQRIEFVWYPLLAVVVVVDDNDEKTVAAARARILGTVTGGLVTFWVHTILSGWIGVLVSILLMVPVLRLLGWQAGLSTAALVSVMFLMIPGHAELNWNYVFNRALDTSVGCAVALAVGLLLWPRNRLQLLQQADAALRRQLNDQLQAYSRWLAGRSPRPQPLDPADFTARLDAMARWIELERTGPHAKPLKQQRWRQRLMLWRSLNSYWLQWERLLGDVQPVPGLNASLDPLIDQLLQTSLHAGLHTRWIAILGTGHGPYLPLVSSSCQLRPGRSRRPWSQRPRAVG
ncbi:MAG: FUSC family protein [Prochlorococcaceae cyanobacterium]